MEVVPEVFNLAEICLEHDSELAKIRRRCWRVRRKKGPGRKRIMCKGPEVGKHVAHSRSCKQARVAGTLKGSRRWCEVGLVR